MYMKRPIELEWKVRPKGVDETHLTDVTCLRYDCYYSIQRPNPSLWKLLPGLIYVIL